MTDLELHFPMDHPVGPGHFPSNPIIPGALLLAETVRLIVQALAADAGSCRVKAAKFLRPVRPGETVSITYSATQQEIRFQCSVGADKVMTGAMDVPH